MKRKISIITVVLNDEKNIEKTLQSVLSQNYNAIEYIVIDGGSTDRTKEIIENYSRSISKFISEKDLGIYDAMNKGILSATGEYVYFLNSGDTLSNSRIISKVVNSITNEDIICGKTKILTSDYSYYSRMPPLKYLKKGLMPHHQAIFVKRKWFMRTRGFDCNFSICSDFDFLCKLYVCKVNIKYIDLEISIFPCGGVSSNLKQIYLQRRKIIKKNFNNYYAYKYYIKKNIIITPIKHTFYLLKMEKLLYKIIKYTHKKNG